MGGWYSIVNKRGLQRPLFYLTFKYAANILNLIKRKSQDFCQKMVTPSKGMMRGQMVQRKSWKDQGTLQCFKPMLFSPISFDLDKQQYKTNCQNG